MSLATWSIEFETEKTFSKNNLPVLLYEHIKYNSCFLWSIYLCSENEISHITAVVKVAALKCQSLYFPWCEAPSLIAAAETLCLASCWVCTSADVSRPSGKSNNIIKKSAIFTFKHKLSDWAAPPASSEYLWWCMRKAMVAALQRLRPWRETIRTREPALTCESENERGMHRDAVHRSYCKL